VFPFFPRPRERRRLSTVALAGADAAWTPQDGIITAAASRTPGSRRSLFHWIFQMPTIETIEDIIAEAERLRVELERIAAALDLYAGTAVDVRDRGALTHLHNTCRDAAYALRRPSTR
jgi:hypothetical protein